MGSPKTIFRPRITPITITPFRDSGALPGAATAPANRSLHGVALESSLGQACNEEAFLHFLSIERKRSRRSGRPFHLLLVRVKKQRAAVDPEVAAKLFACLWQSLRETDLVGWFREGRVAGALLTHMAETLNANVGDLVCAKVRKSFRESLPSDFVRRLEIRAFRLPSGRIELK